ncbi:MAG: hypothetical protein ACXQTZ_00570, partial [Candidatus Alkanophagales archaeon]
MTAGGSVEGSVEGGVEGSVESNVEVQVEEITSEEMAAVDENCEFYGLSRLQLMENAGAAVANEVRAAVAG